MDIPSNHSAMENFVYGVITGRGGGIPGRLLKPVFLVLSWIYGFIVAARNGFYRFGILPVRKLDRPVISVGNITWGGTGKTPLVRLLAEYVRGLNLQPVVLMRGYKKDPRHQEIAQQNDEARMLDWSLRNVPVVTGPDRFRAARAFRLSSEADVFILDDGFQRRQLHRDLDIAVIDSVNPFGNGRLIPAGILREPPAALRRAALIFLTKTDFSPDTALLKVRLEQICPGVPVIETVHQPDMLFDLSLQEKFECSRLQGKKVCVFSAIGDPTGFEKTVTSAGADILQAFRFIDHHRYIEEDLLPILEFARSHHADLIVTTMKDAVKLSDFQRIFQGKIPCMVLDIRIKILNDPHDIFHRINQLLRR